MMLKKVKNIGQVVEQDEFTAVLSFLDRLCIPIFDVIFLCDSGYKIIYISKNIETFTGIAYEYYVGKNIHELAFEGSKVVQINPDQSFEGRFRLKSEHIKEVWVRVECKSGEPTDKRIIGSMTDISDLIFKEKEIKRLRNSIEKLNDELKQMVYITNHDIRTPLINITGFFKEIMISIESIKYCIEEIENSDIRNKITNIINEEIIPARNFILPNCEELAHCISSLFYFSQVSLSEINPEEIYMDKILKEIWSAYGNESNLTKVEIVGHFEPMFADEYLLTILLTKVLNLTQWLKDEGSMSTIIFSSTRTCEGFYYQFKYYYKGKNSLKIIELVNLCNTSLSMPKKKLVDIYIIKKIIEKHDGEIEIKADNANALEMNILIPDKYEKDIVGRR